MTSTQAAAVQTLIDDYVESLCPSVAIGVVAGFFTPVTPAGAVVASSAAIQLQGGDTVAPSSSTPFELGSVSKLFTVGIYNALRSNFGGTLGDHLGSAMTMSSIVQSIPVKCLAGYASGFPQDNGHCPLHGRTIPRGTTKSLKKLFEYLGTYDKMAYPTGTMYSYSNMGMALLSMAALGIDSTDTEAFGTAYNDQLISYCQTTCGVDPVNSTPTTVVYDQIDAASLPAGYDHAYQQKTKPPCSIVKYGSGGIVSNGDDMLKFLYYAMSANYPSFTQQWEWQHPAYCLPKPALGPMNGLGWFLFDRKIGGQTVRLVAKDGGVTGFTSWIGLQQRPNDQTAAPVGVFVLTNGPDAVWLGQLLFDYLSPQTAAQPRRGSAPFPTFSGDPESQ